MTNEELSESLTAHIKQMLDLSDELTSVTERENSLHAELNQCGTRKRQLQREIKESKKLLEFCLDTRSDPTQTRLSNSDNELDTLLNTVGDRKTLMEGFDVVNRSLEDSLNGLMKKRFG